MVQQNAPAQNMKGRKIVIDGEAGSGKSSTAKEIARIYQLGLLDTGAIYRTITFAYESGVTGPLSSHLIEQAIVPVMQFVQQNLQFVWQPESLSNIVYLAEDDITMAIRTPAVDDRVAYIAGLPVVRESVRELQRAFAVNGIVAEGRDLGTAVFPDADYKFFLTASDEVRAQRRLAELRLKGDMVTTYEQILLNIRQRDHMDSSREHSPMAIPSDAVVINTDDLTPEGVIMQIRAGIGTIDKNRKILRNTERLVDAGF